MNMHMSMDMGMGGMDMSGMGMFTAPNMRISHIYWYIIAAVVGVLAARRCIDALRIIIEYVPVFIPRSQVITLHELIFNAESDE